MLNNYTHNPDALVEQVFRQIHQNEMADMPFINPALEVKTVGFELFEGDWLGVLITPWTLNLMLLPGPQREWPDFKVGDKFGLKLPSGDYTFFVGAQEVLGTYLSCSLRSPVDNVTTQQQALQLARDLRRLVTAIPTTELHVQDGSRRALFGKLLGSAPNAELTK